MSELLKMFLVSDVVNFGDIILKELFEVLRGQKASNEFSGNVFALHIQKGNSTLSNLLDPSMPEEEIRTAYLYLHVRDALFPKKEH